MDLGGLGLGSPILYLKGIGYRCSNFLDSTRSESGDPSSKTIVEPRNTRLKALTQNLQNALNKEYTLNFNRLPNMI